MYKLMKCILKDNFLLLKCECLVWEETVYYTWYGATLEDIFFGQSNDDGILILDVPSNNVKPSLKYL